MKKKKYKLDKLLEGITDENLHKEIFTGEDLEQYSNRELARKNKRNEMLKLRGKVEWEGNIDANIEHERSTFAKNTTSEGFSEVPSKEEYEKAWIRMEELLKLVNNDTPETDPNFKELDQVSNIVHAYEEKHYPIGEPTLEYRGFKGTVRWSTNDKCYYGKVIEIDERHLILYEGKDLEQLEKDFKEAIETYLDTKGGLNAKGKYYPKGYKEPGFRSELRVILDKKDWSTNEIFKAIDELHMKYLEKNELNDTDS